VSGGLSDTGAVGSEMGIDEALAGPDYGTIVAPSDTGSVMLQDDLAASATLDSDDASVINADATDADLADDMRHLGGEDFRSDSTSSDTMPSNDLLAEWDAATRDKNSEA
jgi:hypothetical protein